MSRALRAACFGVLLCIGGGAFDLPSLYVPGAGLILIGLGAAAWVWLAAYGAAVLRETGPPTVQEHEPYPVKLRVKQGVLPPPTAELIEPLLGRPLSTREQRARQVRVNVRFSRRGRRAIEPARLVIRDSLSLAVRETQSDATEVLVLPRVEPVVVGAASGLAGMEPVSGALTEAAAELELHSLRPYRAGAPASRIHWPTVARTRVMMERRLVAESDARPLVVLDPSNPPTEEALDRAVRATASLVVHLARRAHGCSLLLPGQRRPTDVDAELRGWPAIHVRLALLEASEGAPSSRRLERSAALYWVSAGGSSLPPAVKRNAGSYFITPEPVSGRAAAFTVAGCAGYRLGSGRERRAA
ncbi:MAG TPA: DUF58 domain-containing protein [Thermoleophilaceae bacterium]